MLKFCSNCNSKLFNTSEGFKCKKCDNYNPNEKKSTVRKQFYSENESFPYVKNEYYVQKEIRNRLELGSMTGINVKKELGIIVLFRNAHTLKQNQTNIYRDKFDEKTGIYRYVGKGLIGDQTLSGDNGILKNAKKYNYTVHLFWQHNSNSDHQYIGKTSVIDDVLEEQPDKDGNKRNVYVFLLEPEK